MSPPKTDDPAQPGSVSAARTANRLRRLPIPTALEALYLLGGVVLALVYAWWIDDAFIYFRYVDNLLFLRVGLVYNAGEYVEGYSSPFWLLLLVPLRALGLDWPAIVRGVGIASYLVFGLLLVALNRRLSPPGPRVNFPLAALSFSYGVLCYFTSGLETPALQAAAAAYALFVVAPGSPALSLFLGVTPLIRPELLVPLLLAAAWSRLRTGRMPWVLFGSALVSLGGWGLVRVVYYAELLPNTFYLKNGFDPEQGWLYLWDTASTYRVVPVALLLLAAAIVMRRSRLELHLCERGVLLLLAVSVAAYVVAIGGDARHYRYLAFPFCLAVAATAGIPEAFLARFLQGSRRRWASALLGLAIAAGAFSAVPPELDRHPITGRAEHRMLNGINDADVHRRDPSLAPEAWEERATPSAMRAYRELHPRFVYRDTVSKAWCAEAYRLFDRRVVQSFGLTDAFLARMRVAPLPEDRPSHKHGLIPLSEELATFLRGREELEPGIFRLAVEGGTAPAWVASNLARVETIAHKVYNRHALLENLELSLAFPPRIVP